MHRYSSSVLCIKQLYFPERSPYNADAKDIDWIHHFSWCELVVTTMGYDSNPMQVAASVQIQKSVKTLNFEHWQKEHLVAGTQSEGKKNVNLDGFLCVVFMTHNK